MSLSTDMLTSVEAEPLRLPRSRRASSSKAFKSNKLPSRRSSLYSPYTSPSKSKHPSSDEFPSGLDDVADWANIPMPDAPAPFERSDSSDAEYKTPPSEPVDEEGTEDDLIFRIPSEVPIRPQPNKKRFHPESEHLKLQAPRKASREDRNSSCSQSHSVNNVQPIHLMSNYVYPNQNLEGPARSVASADLGRSLSSRSSFVTIATNTTTPATSFMSESLATSFGSNLDKEDKTRVPIEARLSREAAADACSRASSEPPRNTQDEWDALADDEHALRKSELMDIDADSVAKKRALPGESGLHEVKEGRPQTALSLGTIDGLPCEQFLAKYLIEKSPTAKPGHHTSSSVSFRQRYEIERVYRYCKIPQTCFIGCSERVIDDYGSLWSSLSTVAATLKTTLPERSSPQAWTNAEGDFKKVSLSGELKFAEQSGGSLFDFTLRPLKIDASYRLARKFGGDRFFTLALPSLESDDLPQYLKPFSAVVRDKVRRWIVDDAHYFVGRKWRAFFVKPETHKKGGKSNNSSQLRYRIFMFAEDGDDFRQSGTRGEVDPRNPIHTPSSIRDMIEWFMPSVQNQDQKVLKFFSRLALSVSSTTPTVVFCPGEMIRSDDAVADNPGPRRLDAQRSEEKRVIGSSHTSKAVIMNDGCARISRAAANDIAEMLGLTQVPSVFQGRIGGAKGMWMIDVMDEHLSTSDRDYWIEITDSQLKFNGHPVDYLDPDRLRLTFEVHDYCRKLRPAALNFQFIPILEDRGVPQDVLQELLKEDLTSKVMDLREAMSDPGSLRRWNQENNPVAGERLANNGVEMLAGLPDSLADQINWFVEHGFRPQECFVLKDLCYKAIHNYCTNLENRMHIQLGRSTSAYMIADPLAILDEGEVHVGFSNLFQDPKSGWSDVMLHEIDVLVARSPALLPSDIQKVRAVFKTELRLYKDVIVFSSKGERPLADKLSGGDYDGDKAWICWEPAIVKPFQNESVPPSPPSKFYGIEESELKVEDILGQPDFLSQFLHHAFEFNLQPNVLGSCTVYHEALCYTRRSMHDPSAIVIAHLLGKLVDRAKAGFTFDQAKWRSFLRQNNLPAKLPKPAYKDRGRQRPTKHIIDRLVFEVAAGVRERALQEFTESLGKVGSWDDDLGRVWNRETQRAKDDQLLLAVRADLKSGLERIFAFWKDNLPERGDEFDMGMPSKKGTSMTLSARLEHCRSSFLALQPLTGISHPVVDRWRSETEDPADAGKSWRFIKASAVFCLWHRSGKFAWYVAGPELGEIKAKAKGLGSYHLIVGGLYEYYKLDGKMLRRKQRRDEETGQWGIEENGSDYGSDVEDFGEWP